MKAHISINAESGLVHAVKSASGHVHDIIEANSLLHGDEHHPVIDLLQTTEKDSDWSGKTSRRYRMAYVLVNCTIHCRTIDFASIGC